MTSLRPKAIMSWSSGKDSAYALYQVLKARSYEVTCLLTTVNESFNRVAMHGVREELLDLQAKELGLPLEKIRIPNPCPNEVYEQKMLNFLNRWKNKGVLHVIFGDLFLEDIRAYREKQLAKLGLFAVFPLWQMETKSLAQSMIKEGFKARLSCIDLKKLPQEFAGRVFDGDFLADLPPKIDPCGENGEFHSFVFSGPLFKEELPISTGKTVERDGFAFTDLMLRG